MTKQLQLTQLGTYQTGIFDEGAAEIPAFDPETNRLFVIDGFRKAIDVFDLTNPSEITPIEDINLDISEFGGDLNSVDVKNGIVVAAVGAGVDVPGNAVFFDTSGQLLGAVEVGFSPDMVTFTPDGTKALVANEGFPNDDYSIDPEGSVSIIDISGGIEDATVTTAGFTAFNGQEDELIESGVRIFGPGASVAQDLEPEYIAVSPDGSTAYVALQENNAIGILDLDTEVFTDVVGLGFKDHSLPGNALDASNRDDGINIQNWPVFGMYQPDAISTYEVGGETYFVTANEGDAREYDTFNEEARIGDVVLDPEAFPDAEELQLDENLGRLKITNTLGDTDGDGDFDELYAYGARSFSIWDAQGNLVFDSGDEFEQITAELVPENFNSTNDDNDSFDDRSDDKGPEPEGNVIGEVDGKTYLFTGLERVGGIAVHDISDPTDPQFVQYINTRNFDVPETLEDGSSNPAAGDLAPEGLDFVAAEDSPTGRPLLIVANEVSGSTSTYDFGGGVIDDTPFVGSAIGNLIWGTDGNDIAAGGLGDDAMFGREGDDVLRGDLNNRNSQRNVGGDDVIFGGKGDDRIGGKGGNDRLFGDMGDDQIWGDDGDDLLRGGLGDDTLTGDDFSGGSGSDTFVLAEGEGTDTITDFEVGTDLIGLANGLTFADISISAAGGNTEIAHGDEVLAVLEGVSASLGESDFVPFL
ncbi:MAG: choice-of-anchor I family protein [Limnospira sp.]